MTCYTKEKELCCVECVRRCSVVVKTQDYRYGGFFFALLCCHVCHCLTMLLRRSLREGMGFFNHFRGVVAALNWVE